MEFVIPLEAIEHICQPGSNDAAVEWELRHGEWTQALVELPFAEKCAILLQYGAWTLEELTEDEELTNERLVWCAAWRAFDEDRMEPGEPFSAYEEVNGVPSGFAYMDSYEEDVVEASARLAEIHS